jgi:hypothetical protein
LAIGDIDSHDIDNDKMKDPVARAAGSFSWHFCTGGDLRRMIEANAHGLADKALP